MPENLLHADLRDTVGTKSARRARRAGQLPAVLYGHKEETQSVCVPREAFEALLRGGHRMVALDLGGQTQQALIKDVQFDHLGDEVLHADLVRVAMDETVEIQVPVAVHGTPAGVKEGGVLDVLLHEVTVECLPGDIPEAIRVRVDGLGMNDTLHLSAVEMPPRVKALDDPETPVASVNPPTVVEEEAAPEEEGPAAPEVIGKEEEAQEAATEEPEAD